MTGLDSAYVDHLARDYRSVRALLLDRLATLLPDWHDDNPADPLQTVVEVLAYAADQLAYFQDAVGTEAHLSTARRRVSVRRHARLLGYPMHEGCNARVWVQVIVDDGEPVLVPAGTRVLTRVGVHTAPVLADTVVPASGVTVFETITDAVLHPGPAQFALHLTGELAGGDAAGGPAPALAAGATSALLRGTGLGLTAGQVLLLRAAGDQDAFAVRLTAAEPDAAPVDGTGLTRITWHPDDALPAALPLAGGAVAIGNLVLADHGQRVPAELVTGSGARLSRTGLTWCQPLPVDADQQPASGLLRQDPAQAGAALAVADAQRTWQPRPDLLGSDRLAAHLVVEMEQDGTAVLRFGDGEYGRRPDLPLSASYRVGNGAAGNIGRDALVHLVPGPGVDLRRVVSVGNPVPAVGGTDPEPMGQTRLAAARVPRQQSRCVVEQDYVAVAVAHPQVRAAAVTLTWTGSWHSAVVVVDRQGGQPVDPAFRDELLAWLAPYRLIGTELQIRGPLRVPVELTVEFGPAVGHRPDQVSAAVHAALTETTFADRGIGEPLYLSQVIARAAAVPGVAWADLRRFGRRGQPDPGELDTGVLQPGPYAALELSAAAVTVLTTGEPS
ncbi:baseplate J/gp47 family protein [Micromonospora endophytica]|uniref:Baseplate assembly protein n=1 Tax=Micromonospora endophytica TaxID=515350 RepID=A0A2W2DLG7_9ACTN|nr:baseplate J/gp47 family protein [Micromonospora endophytica]PZF98016.1 hypothetical protein C1I93_09985 [Micromonospora endophytica]RIW49857.1 hypothetical protein D3H59_03605 [Micromonospora endophytica]BCJ57209.1 putative baseplate assembly protein [Micromonospora endophytica]